MYSYCAHGALQCVSNLIVAYYSFDRFRILVIGRVRFPVTVQKSLIRTIALTVWGGEVLTD